MKLLAPLVNTRDGNTLPSAKMSRKACQFVWMDPNDCDPPHSLDMSSKHDADKVEMLRRAFAINGFDKNYPALVGYPLDGRVQLLSGTHRHMAARLEVIKIPVTIWLRSDVEETWGTELWDSTISDIPVKELESYPVKDGFIRSPHDRVDFSAKDN